MVPLYELEQKGAFVDGNPAGIAFATGAARQVGVGAARHDRRCLAGERRHGVGYPMIAVRDIEAGRHMLSRDDFGRD